MTFIMSVGIQNNESDQLVILVAILIVLGLILAVWGIAQGRLGRIVVYKSRADLHTTGASLFGLACTVLSSFLGQEDAWVFWGLLAVTTVLMANSAWGSFRGNTTLWHGLLSVAAKYLLLVLFALCAVIALGGVLDVVDKVQRKKYEDAAASGLVAGLATAGFVAMRKLLNRLTRTPANKPQNQGEP